jgi:hypothetical protein
LHKVIPPLTSTHFELSEELLLFNSQEERNENVSNHTILPLNDDKNDNKAISLTETEEDCHYHTSTTQLEVERQYSTSQLYEEYEHVDAQQKNSANTKLLVDMRSPFPSRNTILPSFRLLRYRFLPNIQPLHSLSSSLLTALIFSIVVFDVIQV